MKKFFVVDTNVLIHDPLALYAFKEHQVVIPMTVLEELDTIKDRKDKDVSREARIAINAIDNVVADASPKAIQNGVEIPDTYTNGRSGTLAIFPDQLINHDNDVRQLLQGRNFSPVYVINAAMKGRIRHGVATGYGGNNLAVVTAQVSDFKCRH